jgi:energy-coupling factor transporter transmembrane protein EcfT
MDAHWVAFLAIWFIVELVQFFRKKPLRSMLKAAAIWAVVLMSLITIGGLPREMYDTNPLAAGVIAVGMNGLVAAVLYWLRVLMDKGWKRLRQRPA